MARCPVCRAATAPGKRFCTACGSPVALSCPACAAPTSAGEHFCGSCGAAIVTPAASAPETTPLPPASEAGGRSAPESGRVLPETGPRRAGVEGRAGGTAGEARPLERRRVSVLFCDLVGYTSLAEHRDPEDVRDLLSGYFDVARTIVARHDGVVGKFIGDAVMGLWGAPAAHEDDAARAVRAALELLSAVPAYGSASGVELACRVGVATGVAATTDGADEGLVVGDRVNTAARIEAAAAPGSCLVDETTMRLAGDAIELVEAGVHELKGKAAGQRLYRAVRARPAGRDGATSGPRRVPFVGRDAELRTVVELFQGAATRRVTRLVVVCGPAGVGKTRLADELERHLGGLAEPVTVHRGRCLAYGEGVAFWALAEIARQRLGIAEGDPPEIADGKLSEGLTRDVPEGERDYVGTRLARLLGLALPGVPDESLPRDELFAGWRIFFEHLAQRGPVVLVLDDGHRADESLLDFLGHLVDWSRALPLLVLVLARPELAAARPDLGAGRARSTLWIDALDDASMASLLEGLVPGIPEQAMATITRRSEGVPLFAIETVRALVDTGIAHQEGDGYRLTAEVGELGVPDSLHGLLAARLDALDRPTRDLLAVAAALGASFSAAALAAVARMQREEVQVALERLLRRGVLETGSGNRRDEYRFTPELLRDVAYSTLGRHERKALHLAAATELRLAHVDDGEEIAEVIARHYLAALEARPGDIDAGVLHEEGLAMTIRAAEGAERSGAPARAVSAYTTAAALVEHPSASLAGGTEARGDRRQRELRAAELFEHASRAARLAGDWAAAIEHAAEARGRYHANDHRRGAARAQLHLAQGHHQLGRLGEARTLLDESLSVLGQPPDSDTLEALGELAAIELFEGGPDGERLAAESLGLAQALGAGPRQLARLFLNRGIAHVFASRAAEGAACYREAARLAAQADDTATHANALVNLSDALGGFDPRAAAEAARAAGELARRIGDRRYTAVSTANLLTALYECGEWDQADIVLAAAAEHDGLGDDEYLCCIGGWLAALRGDARGAQRILDSLGQLRASELAQDQADVALLRSLAGAALGQQPEALRCARDVLARAPALGIRHEALRWAWPLAARLAHELGDAAALRDLIAVLDRHPAGHLPPLLQASRVLAETWASTSASDARGPDAGDAVRGAVIALRRAASPYHLALGLLDQAELMVLSGERGAANDTAGEARMIGARLRCTPVLERADRLIAERAGIP